MPNNVHSLRTTVRDKLSAGKHTLESLEAISQQIIVFGSTAVGKSTADSDLDLLCIGEGARWKSRMVDLIFIKPASRASERWLGCELATHIAKYGIWIFGEDDWSSKTFISDRSINLKRRIVAHRVKIVRMYWPEFSLDLKKKYAIKLRRDLQRFSLLSNGMAVRPSPLLDEEWLQSRSQEHFESLLVSAGQKEAFSEKDIHDLMRLL